MSYSGEFEGAIIVDGKLRSDGVGVWMNEHYFVLKEVTRLGLCRFNIYLWPFTESMILERDAESMREGLFFDIRGKKVGTVSDGPLGHPADGEFHQWTITAFRSTTTYFADRVEININGQTTAGVDNYNPDKVLPAVAFSVRFAMPKERIMEFFKLDERAQTTVLAAFTEAFP